MKIKIDLIELPQEVATAHNIRSCYFINNEEMSENDRLARDILAPLSVAQLMRKKGAQWQKSQAHKIGQDFAESSACCGGAVWSCAVGETRQALTFADGFRVYAFGQVSPRGCFVLILENNNEEERAYLVRPNW